MLYSVKAKFTKSSVKRWKVLDMRKIGVMAVYERTTVKYGDRGIRYVYMEAGHTAQNLCLQATAMDLGTVTVGAFYDGQVKEVLNLPEDEQPLYIIPVGKK